MKRPMCILAAAWLAGLLLAGRWPGIKISYFLFSYFFLMILGLFILNKHPQCLQPYVHSDWYPKLTILLLLIPCLFLGGFWRMNRDTASREAAELPWRYLKEEGETYVTLEGTVKAKQCEESVILELTDCVIIGYYGQEDQSAGNCRIKVEEEGKEWLPETFIGNKIRVFGTFSVYQTAGNPGQFNAYAYYRGKGLYAEVKALRITLLDAGRERLGHTLFMLKQRLQECLTSLYPEEKAGVLAAMILGEKDLLSEEIEDLYRKNGISHILAISGLHISMLCMGLFGLLRKLTVSPRVSSAVAIAFLCFYVLFTGASTSSLRAGIMCLVMFGATLFRRSYDLLSSLSFAAILVTALRPTELYSAGFLLSFGAVLGVAVAKEVEYWLKEERQGLLPWWSALLFGGMIQCMTMPVSLWFFYELSPYSILLNLVVIPLVSLILGGGIFSAVLGLFFLGPARIPAGGTYLLLEFYEWLCSITQKLPFSYVLLGRPPVWQVVLYYGVLFVALHVFFVVIMKKVRETEETLQKENRSVLIPVFGMLLCFGVLFLPKGQRAELIFLDVSQGDGALLFTKSGHVILSDCGSSDVTKVGEYRLLPVVKQRGVLLIDMAVVSHLDSDHTSGIQELLENMPVFDGVTRFAAQYEGSVGIQELILPKVKEKSEAYMELERLALEKNVAIRYLEAGERLYQEENLLIECLSPSNAKESENDTSLVLLLQTPGLVAWLMGDAETGSEEKIMERLATVDMQGLCAGKLVLLKVGHHGSKTSSGKDFIQYVQPDIAVISCGYRNSYGHPHSEVLKRLEYAKSTVFRTDLQGAIVVELDSEKEIAVRGWLEKQRK